MLPRKPRWTLWPTRSWQNKPQKRVKSEKTSCPHTGCDKITRYAGSFLSGCRTAARGRECSVILAWKPELRRKFRSDGTARHITGDLLKYILAVGNDKSVFADHLFQLGEAHHGRYVGVGRTVQTTECVTARRAAAVPAAAPGIFCKKKKLHHGADLTAGG